MTAYLWIPGGLVVVTVAGFAVVMWLLAREDFREARRDDPLWAARLTASMKAAGEAVEPGPGGLEAIQARLGADTHAWGPESLTDRFRRQFPYYPGSAR